MSLNVDVLQPGEVEKTREKGRKFYLTVNFGFIILSVSPPSVTLYLALSRTDGKAEKRRLFSLSDMVG